MYLIVIFSIFPFWAIAEPQAIRRPDSRMFSCADATAIVQQNGAVVFQFAQDWVFRVVANEANCMPDERAVSAYFPTLDQDRCQIGFLCVPADNR